MTDRATPVIPTQVGTQPDKPLREMTDAELRDERAKWNQKIVDAPGWGAAVAAAGEFLADCDREIERRQVEAGEVDYLDGLTGANPTTVILDDIVPPLAPCHDCARPYGAAHGFPDLVVPFDVWRRISPTGDDGGLLCPSCLCKRLHDAGITCEGAFLSGPVRSVSPDLMTALRRVENLELMLEGRDNRWGEAFDTRVLRTIRHARDTGALPK